MPKIPKIAEGKIMIEENHNPVSHLCTRCFIQKGKYVIAIFISNGYSFCEEHFIENPTWSFKR